MTNKSKTNNIGLISFVFGIVSIFFWSFYWIPIIAFVSGIWSMVNHVRFKNQILWQAIIGTCLGLIYIIVALFNPYI